MQLPLIVQLPKEEIIIRICTDVCVREHAQRWLSSYTVGLGTEGRWWGLCYSALTHWAILLACDKNSMWDININFISTHSYFYIITRLYNQEKNFRLKVIPVGSLHKPISLKLEYANSNTERSITT